MINNKILNNDLYKICGRRKKTFLFVRGCWQQIQQHKCHTQKQHYKCHTRILNTNTQINKILNIDSKQNYWKNHISCCQGMLAAVAGHHQHLHPNLS